MPALETRGARAIPAFPPTRIARQVGGEGPRKLNTGIAREVAWDAALSRWQQTADDQLAVGSTTLRRRASEPLLGTKNPASFVHARG